ncbi:hypothetical protein DNX69_02800 [Rhodopseudomonas palustris]|uniref:RiboL-PSP-HEPN domain-containing protein n=1 Tax=Rhodopseudomonas palustris TaxID=1076 RepID=A0A323UM26_RHOPL|nr:hypothetical protein [Rhodopseudomonas palustris]PZA13317.1 hypothetical protein DNX69_02800 [Rhodopseudomonas palustris]
MATNDTRLEEAHKHLKERIEKYDDRILAVLKGHLSAEQSLNELLRAAKRRWRRRTFAGKIDVAKQLCLPDLSEQLWTILENGNDLRNAVAHGHQEGTINQRMAHLKKALLAWSSPEQKPGVETMTDTQMVSTAFYSTGSFLIVAAMRLEGKY